MAGVPPVPYQSPLSGDDGIVTPTWAAWFRSMLSNIGSGSGGGGTGTVTSVGLSMPSDMTVTNSPITTSGTLVATRNDQVANTVLAGPATGLATTPTYRALVVADVPTLNQNTTGSAASFTGSLSGDVTGTQGATAIAAATVTGKALTGYVSGAGTVAATDSVLGAIQKLNGNDGLRALSSRLINTTAPLTGGGDLSADRTLAMPAATNSVDGYLTAADHTTFAGKQAAGNYITGTTGDVVATGPGSVAATIQANAVTTTKINNSAVTYAKIQNVSANSVLLGAGASGSGAAPVEIAIGTGLTMTGTTLSATSSGAAALTQATKTANYTLTDSDDVIFASTTSAFTLTLHAASTAKSKPFYVVNIGANNLTIARTGSDLIQGETSQTIMPGASVLFIPNSGGNWYVF